MPHCIECGEFFEGENWMKRCSPCFSGGNARVQYLVDHGALEKAICVGCGNEFTQRFNNDPGCSDCIEEGFRAWKGKVEEDATIYSTAN